jgi:hypothetical protein
MSYPPQADKTENLLYARTRELGGVFYLPYTYGDFGISNPADGLRRAFLWGSGAA